MADTTSRPGLLCRLDGRHAADEPTYRRSSGRSAAWPASRPGRPSLTRNESPILLWYPTPGREDAPRSWEPA